MFKISPTGKKHLKRCYKRSFTTKRKCKRAIKKAKRNTKRKLKSAYLCGGCGFWHMSHLTLKEYKSKVSDYKLMRFLESDLQGVV